MFIEFTTTITHKIELGEEGIDSVSHAVEIDASKADGLPQVVIYKIVEAGCTAALSAVRGATATED